MQQLTSTDTNSLLLAVKVALAVCALLSAWQPRQAIYLFYRSRNLTRNAFLVTMIRLVSALAFLGLTCDLIFEFFGRGH